MSEWISVKDRTPERGEAVLIVWSGYVQKIAFRWTEYEDGKVWEPAIDLGVDAMPFDGVTHWRPLPEPPKGGK